MTIHLIVGLIKKISLYKMSYFPEPYTRNKKKIKAELELSNYAKKKTDLKTQQVTKDQNFSNLTGFKTTVQELNVDKLKKVPSGLSSLKNEADKLDVDTLVPVQC